MIIETSNPITVAELKEVQFMLHLVCIMYVSTCVNVLSVKGKIILLCDWRNNNSYLLYRCDGLKMVRYFRAFFKLYLQYRHRISSMNSLNLIIRISKTFPSSICTIRKNNHYTYWKWIKILMNNDCVSYFSHFWKYTYEEQSLIFIFLYNFVK